MKEPLQRSATKHSTTMLMFVLTIGAFDIQAATYWVDGPNPAASDTGPGSATVPFKTIQRAMDAVSAGDTVNIRTASGYVYREQITVSSTHSGTSANPITVQAENPANKPEIRGSDLFAAGSGTWTADSGSIWKMSVSIRPQQVFVDFNDTAPLTMMGLPTADVNAWANSSPPRYPAPIGGNSPTKADMVQGSFWWDAATQTLYVWLADNSDPNSHNVEVSQRQWLFNMSQVSNIYLKNLKFRHSNSITWANSSNGYQGHAVALGAGCRLEQADIQWTDFSGVAMAYLAADSQVLDSVISNNGDIGITAPGSYNFLVRGTTLKRNNYRGFSGLWHAGGFKAAADAYGVVEHNIVGENNGTGIWFDFCDTTDQKLVHHNYIFTNAAGEGRSGVEAGFMFEGSKNVIFFNNILSNCKRRTIYISHSEDSLIYNNTIINPKGSGRGAIEVDGVETATATLKNTKIFNNIIYYDSVGGADANAATYYIFMREPNGTNITGNEVDNNVYYRASGTGKWRWRRSVSAGDGDFSTFAAWRTSVNTSAFGFWDANSKNADPVFGAQSSDSYPLSSGSPAVDAGRTLTEVTDDYIAVPRPQGTAFDVGAYEFVSGASPAGLVGHWKMDENSGTTTADSSGSGNTGVLTNATWTTSSIAGAAALDFNGTSALVSCGNGSSLNVATAMSISGWFKHSSSGGSQYSGVDKTGAYRLVAIEANGASSHWQFYITDSSGVAHYVQTLASYSNDVWHYVAGTFDGTQLKIYIDGSLAASTNWSGTIKTNTSPFIIGRREASSYYQGTIDSVKIYNRTLSDTEIAAEYSHPN